MITSNEILQSIGQNIRRYREQKGGPQEELAFKCGLY